jgi:hypothetical protein
MTDLVDTLRCELTAVEADNKRLETEAARIQALLRSGLDKAEKLKAVISVYGDPSVEENQPQHSLFADAVVPPPPLSPVKSGEPRTSKTASLMAEVTDLLSKRGTEHRQKILEHLVAKGLMGHEKNPMASLAAFLSGVNRNVFVADGRGNFSLRRDSHHEPSPAPVPDAGTTGPST